MPGPGSALRSGGITQDGRTSSTLQAIALASTRVTCFVFNKLTERFIRIVLDVLSQYLQRPIADQCLVEQGRSVGSLKNSSIPSRDEFSELVAPLELQAIAPASSIDRKDG